MNKFDFIDWPATVSSFGYIIQKLKPLDKVIVRCVGCKEPQIVQFRIIRKKKGKPYRPICRACKQRETWQNDAYRKNQTKKQSAAMTEVWKDQDYRNNLTKQISINTKKKWEDPQFRQKVVAGVTKAHAKKPGYTEKAVAALHSQPEKARTNLEKRYHEPGYNQRFADSTKLVWADPAYRQKMLEIYKSHDWRLKVSEGVKQAWEDPNYRAIMMAIITSPENKQHLSTMLKKYFADQEHYQEFLEIHTDPDLRKQITESIRRFWNDPIRSAKASRRLSESSKQNWANPIYRQKMLDLYANPVYKQKQSELTKEFWKNEDYRSLILPILAEHSKNNWANPEYRQKMAAIYANPEYRRRNSERMKKLWEDPEYVAKFNTHFKSAQEDLLASYFTDLNIKFTRQFLVGHWPFDFMVDHNNQKYLVEVQGDYWHNKVEQRARDAAKATYVERYHSDTYQFKTIWEHEFLCPERTIGIIGSWFGQCRHELFDFSIADTRIEQITDRSAATLLFSKYHYTANAGRCGLDIGLFLEDQLIACARFCNPTRDQSTKRLGLKNGELLELTRFVIHPSYQKKNVASHLLGRSINLIRKIKSKVKCLLTFADATFGHTGIIYRASNWIYDGTIAPDYFYVNVAGYVMHKKTMWDHAKKMGMVEIEYASSLGYTRHVGMTKKRFLYWYK